MARGQGQTERRDGLRVFVTTSLAEVEAKLAELEPLIAERDELLTVAQSLGLEVGTAPMQIKASRGTRRRKLASNGVSRAARDEQVTAIVMAKPGITVKGVADELGIDATSLYRVVRRLESAGTIRKTGKELQPA